METLIIIAAAALFLIWRFKPVKGIQSITTEQLKGMLGSKDVSFIDVRTPAEFKSSHIRQFDNIPLGSDLSRLPRDKEVVVICQSGMRSSQACKQLKKLGYEKITNVRGGMSAWRG